MRIHVEVRSADSHDGRMNNRTLPVEALIVVDVQSAFVYNSNGLTALY
ncbi:hypothetical protein [Streptomyces enissocaesilis]